MYLIMSPCKPKYLRYIMGLFVIAISAVHTKKLGMIGIPVSINPIVQASCMEMSSMSNFFYQMDKDFYSRVTVSDAARHEDKNIAELIKKKIGVLFLITASSHVSGSLTMNNLKYAKRNSKWSYKIPVQQIIQESNGTFTKLSDKIPMYRVQKLAMKALERRYGFSVDAIQNKLHLKPMEFYAVDEEQWIDVVGIITEYIIKNRSKILNLTPCYLAELVNKTQKEMAAFTLDEVDTFLYNTSMLMEQLPLYKQSVVSNLYKTFDITATQLASMGNTNITVINTMGVKNLIELLTTTILKKFHLTDISASYQKPEAEIKIPCRLEWDSFRIAVILEAFKNEAKEMFITSETLASLIRVSHNDLKTFSLNKMLQLVETVIKPLKHDKKVIENHTLLMLRNIHGSKRLRTNKHNVLYLLKRFTNFSKRQLRVLYGWTSHDYHFAKLFSVDDLARECSLDVYKHSLLSLARLNVGEVNKELKCQTFSALRMVWGQASLRDLKEIFSASTHVPLDKPIANTVSLLTNSSTTISCRVLSNTLEIQWLLKRISLNNISALTNYTTDYLKELPIQRIMIIMHDLRNAGSFEADRNLDITTINYSSKTVSEFNEEFKKLGKQHVPYESPTALPRSLSTRTAPGNGLSAALCVAVLIRYATGF